MKLLHKKIEEMNNFRKNIIYSLSRKESEIKQINEMKDNDKIDFNREKNKLEQSVNEEIYHAIKGLENE
jgi:hypothetical protein